MASPRSATAWLAALLALAGCGSGSSSTAASPPPPGEGRSIVVGSAPPCIPPSSIPLGNVAELLPPGLAMPPGSRLLERDVTGGVTTVVGETRTPIAPLLAHFKARLTAAGRVIFSEDNEGIEAELFFSVPGGRIGVLRETRARCPVGVTRFSVTVN